MITLVKDHTHIQAQTQQWLSFSIYGHIAQSLVTNHAYIIENLVLLRRPINYPAPMAGEPMVWIMVGTTVSEWEIFNWTDASLTAGQTAPSCEWLLCAFGHSVIAPPIHPRAEFDDPHPVPDDETVKVKEIKPNFDLRKALTKLENSDLAEQLSILQAIHERFWHATIKDMERLLQKGGSSPRVIRLVAQVVRSCKVCREWQRGLTKSTLRAEMAGFP